MEGESSAQLGRVFGPEVYEARRAQWRTPKPPSPASSSALPSHSETPNSRDASTSAAAPMTQLRSVLLKEGVEEDDQVWDTFLKGIHTKLIGGKRLKTGLPLDLAIKILRAGWLRDGTWTGENSMPVDMPVSRLTTTTAGTRPRTTQRSLLTQAPDHRRFLPSHLKGKDRKSFAGAESPVASDSTTQLETAVRYLASFDHSGAEG